MSHPMEMASFRGRRATPLAAILPVLAVLGATACRPKTPAAEPPAAPGEQAVATAVPASAAPASGPPWIAWADVTEERGVRFRHVNGARGRKQMLETLGSGVCVFDADGDGRQDLYFVQSGALPGDPPVQPPPRAALLRNAGGRFEDATETSGLADTGHYGFGCVAGDIDGDGDRDLFVAGFGSNRLYVNQGNGRFEERARAAGVAGGGWSTSATFFDADRDGDLDLYVARYVVYDMQQDLYCGENRPGYRTVCHPKNFDAEADLFYRNRGDGTFVDATHAAGLDEHSGKGLGVVAGDIDGDGDDDLYVANDDTPNFLWRSRGDGTFEEIGQAAGVALSEDGVPQAGMGTDMADYDNDGRPDLFVTNLAEETNELYHNDGDGGFSNRTSASGLGPPSLLMLGFGTFFLDADLDGRLDLFVGNGHIIDNIALYSDTITFEMPSQLYRNRGDGRFELAPASGPFAGRYVVRGAVPFDFDDDGDEDIVLSQNDRIALLWRNDGPSLLRPLVVTLEGRPPNRDAIGAVAVLETRGTRQARFARTGMSYGSQADRRLFFAVDPRTAPFQLLVRWPGDKVAERFDIPSPAPATIRQGTGRRIGR
ncbi:MAG TPA: VCBS repeat-containing protein [Candidatus Polarisedimenticolia bacterium]|nr:VCBS repeat-containing protein [Candidatus Polarisedimenticolia bacterium]